VTPKEQQSSAQDVSQNNGASHGYDGNNTGNAGYGNDSGAQSANQGYQQNDNSYGNEEQEDQEDAYGQVGIKEDG
jgi:hypothetical protein